MLKKIAMPTDDPFATSSPDDGRCRACFAPAAPGMVCCLACWRAVPASIQQRYTSARLALRKKKKNQRRVRYEYTLARNAVLAHLPQAPLRPRAAPTSSLTSSRSDLEPLRPRAAPTSSLTRRDGSPSETNNHSRRRRPHGRAQDLVGVSARKRPQALSRDGWSVALEKALPQTLHWLVADLRPKDPHQVSPVSGFADWRAFAGAGATLPRQARRRRGARGRPRRPFAGAGATLPGQGRGARRRSLP